MKTKKATKVITTPKTIIKATKNEELEPTDLDRALNEMSQEEDDDRTTDEDFKRYEQEDNAREEYQLNTGEYSLLKHI